uniref:CCHC-type domain-containing protein n=1 Tax=Tanacetum cinerariifolium TaxID=118510 RepID=A0A6L2P2T7_TANCI|nr:hypothetical protein [Tanacetum cinerariifolium]
MFGYQQGRPNGDALRKCILCGPYRPITVLVQAVAATDESLAIPEHTTVKTPMNMSPKNKANFQVEKEAIHLILTGIGDEIYSTVDACQTAQEIFYKLMNEMIQNNLTVATMQDNVQFLRQLQPEWSRFVTIAKQQHKRDEVSYHKLFDILKQYKKEVNELRAERLARNANPLALVATAQANQDPYYQASKSHKSYAPSSKPSIPTRTHTTTRYKGKEIAKPITPPSETAFEKDSDPEQAQRDKDMQKNLALIAKYFKKIYKPTNNNLRTSSNSRNKNVDTTLRPVVQQFGIQCFNCKEFGHFAKECRKPKRVKDSVYHKEKMLLCKKDEKADPGTDSERLEQVQNDARYNVFANDLQHFKQSESISNTCLVETDDSNVISDSPDICDDDIHNDQNDVKSDDERVALANLIANLKLDVDENKEIQKQLKKANTTLAQELKECKTILAETSKTLRESNSVRDSCLVALQNKKSEFEKYKAFNDRTIDYDKLEHKLNETLGQLAQKYIKIKEGLKTKAYEISVVKEKHDELIKQILLTKSHYEGLVKQKTKIITNLKLREEHNIDKMLSMEKQLKFLNEIVYKRSQSIQTIHMMAPKVPTYNGRPTFANPRYVKQAQSEIPSLYAFPYDQSTHAYILIPDGEETLALERESRSKLNKDLVQFVDNAWIKHSKDQFCAPTAEDMEILIQMPLAIKTQNDSFIFVHELKQEMHVDLKYVESLEKEIDELESDKAGFSNMYDMILQECVSNDVMCSYLLSLSDLDVLAELQCLYLHKVKECDCLTQKLSKQNESVSKEVHTELLQRFAKVKKHSISLEIALQKCKGKYVETMFDKPSVIRKPNAQRIPKPSVLGKPTPFSNSLERKHFRRTKSVPKTNVSEGLSKPVNAHTLPPIAWQAVSNTNVLKPRMYQIDNRTTQTRAPQSLQTVRNTNPRVSTSIGVNHQTNVSRPQHKSNQLKDKVMPNNSQVKPKKIQIEEHHRISSIFNKTKSVTACNNNLNSRTSNLNAVCATCGKCLVDPNHFACVTKMLNDVNARTMKPNIEPISTRKPKGHANKSVATPHKKKVASKPTNQKPQSYFRMLYEKTRNITINRVYYVKGLNYNLFSVGQICDADLEVAFQKSTFFVRDLQGNDLPTASPTQAWLWHRRLSHLNFDYINLLSKKDVVIGLPKLKYVKDQLCFSCELSKAKGSSFKSKVVPCSKGRLNLLHMDLFGPMQVASINEKKYILVIVDDYSRYAWTLFQRSKDETP